MGTGTRTHRILLLASSVLIAATAHAAPWVSRLDAMLAAADRYLDESPAKSSAYPAQWRRVAWLQLAGDARPDALLVLKARKDECAVAATGNAPCKALVMLADAAGGYRVATEFSLLVHPVVLETGAQGVRALLHTRETGAAPRYRRYGFNGQGFESTGEVDPADLPKLRAFTLDDRNMSMVADQAYAARQFSNDASRLAPFRLHFDAYAISAERIRGSAVIDDSFDARVGVLLDALRPDAVRLASAIGWPQTLELRVWSCVDWMVSRRFWEVEDRRVGRVGVCADPAVFAHKQRLVASNAEFVALARYRLLREVGIAYLLRVAPLTLETRAALKAPTATDRMIFLGASAGLLLGQALKLQTFAEAAQAHRAMQQVSQRWFEEVEFKEENYTRPTPELRGFDHELRVADQALQCARQLQGDGGARAPEAAVCPKAAAELVEQVRAILKESLVP